MNELINSVLESHWAQALGWSLIHSIWEGAAIGAGVLAATAGVRSAERRYTVFCAGLAGLLVAFATTFSIKAGNGSPARRTDWPSSAMTISATHHSPPENDFAIAKPEPRPLDWNRVAGGLVWVWLTGVVAMSFRAAGAAWQVHSLRSRSRAWPDEAWHTKLASWAREIGISKAVRLALTEQIDVPSVIGFFKPLILLPAALVTRLSTAQLEAVLLHELMHVRLNDYLVNLLQVACETVLFFHPVAWWLSSAIRQEREHCCDELAARKQGSRLEYAKALVSLEEMRLEPAPTFGLATSGGSLKKRISRLLRPNARMRGGWGIPLLTLILAGGIIIGLWPKARAQSTPENAASWFQLRLVVDRTRREQQRCPTQMGIQLTFATCGCLPKFCSTAAT